MVRLASPDDADALAELSRRTFRETYSMGIPPEVLEPYIATHFDVQALAAEIRQPRTQFLVASEESRLIGYARLTRSMPPECVSGPRPVELQRLYVAREHHRTGVGSRLLREALDAARAQHHETLWLAVWEENPQAIAFYERSGFREVGGIPFRMGETLYSDHVMARPI